MPHNLRKTGNRVGTFVAPGQGLVGTVERFVTVRKLAHRRIGRLGKAQLEPFEMTILGDKRWRGPDRE